MGICSCVLFSPSFPAVLTHTLQGIAETFKYFHANPQLAVASIYLVFYYKGLHPRQMCLCGWAQRHSLHTSPIHQLRGCSNIHCGTLLSPRLRTTWPITCPCQSLGSHCFCRLAPDEAVTCNQMKGKLEHFGELFPVKRTTLLFHL